MQPKEIICIRCYKPFDNRDRMYGRNFQCYNCCSITEYLRCIESAISERFNEEIRLGWRYTKRRNAKYNKSHGLAVSSNILDDKECLDTIKAFNDNDKEGHEDF